MSSHRNQNRRASRKAEPKAPPQDGADLVTLVVEVKKSGLVWLESLAAANGMEPRDVLTLLADVGRNVLDSDPLHPDVLRTLASAGFNGYRVNEGFGSLRWMGDELPF